MNKKTFSEEDLQNAFDFGERGDRDALYNLLIKNKSFNYPIDMSEDAKQKRKDVIKQITDIANKAWEDANNEGDSNEKQYWIHGFLSGHKY